jgi:hypothetical protein
MRLLVNILLSMVITYYVNGIWGMLFLFCMWQETRKYRAVCRRELVA